MFLNEHWSSFRVRKRLYHWRNRLNWAHGSGRVAGKPFRCSVSALEGNRFRSKIIIMRNEITLLLRGLGDKIDPQISAFLLHGLETGAFDYSIYTEVYDVKIVVNQGNEDTLRKLLDKFKLITRSDVHRVIERCLSIDVEPIQEFEEEEQNLSFI